MDNPIRPIHVKDADLLNGLIAYVTNPLTTTWTIRDLAVLLLLDQSPNERHRRVLNLSNRLRVPKAVITRALHMLQANEFVTRRVDQNDRRNAFFDLTEEGRAFASLVPEMNETF